MTASLLINTQYTRFKIKISIEKLLSFVFFFELKNYQYSSSSEHKDVFSWTFPVPSEQNTENTSVAKHTV